MRYHPKGSKLCRRTKATRNLTDAHETRNDAAHPISSTESCVGESDAPPKAAYFTIFNPDAPAMTGIARKNENSAASTRGTPIRVAPRIVEPERDVPGISANI